VCSRGQCPGSPRRWPPYVAMVVKVIFKEKDHSGVRVGQPMEHLPGPPAVERAFQHGDHLFERDWLSEKQLR